VGLATRFPLRHLLWADGGTRRAATPPRAIRGSSAVLGLACARASALRLRLRLRLRLLLLLLRLLLLLLLLLLGGARVSGVVCVPCLSTHCCHMPRPALPAPSSSLSSIPRFSVRAKPRTGACDAPASARRSSALAWR
jgi:hypothetical protein